MSVRDRDYYLHLRRQCEPENGLPALCSTVRILSFMDVENFQVSSALAMWTLYLGARFQLRGRV